MSPPADWEMNLVMPLGVIANQLIKIEGDLRFLSMKVVGESGEDGTRSTMAVERTKWTRRHIRRRRKETTNTRV